MKYIFVKYIFLQIFFEIVCENIFSRKMWSLLTIGVVGASKPKLLITGGAGFIGSTIAKQALTKYDVGIVDNLSTGSSDNIPHEAEFFNVDITNLVALEQVFASFKPDYVCHQAAHVSVPKSVQNPQYDAQVNILGSINLFELSLKYGVKRVVFASSGGSIYGSILSPADESSTFNPSSPYSISKVAVEMYAKYYNDRGLSVKSLRYANVYGPRQAKSSAIAIFLDKFTNNAPVVINGECVRDHVHVDDVAAINIIALEKADFPSVLNVGSGSSLTIHEVALKIKHALNSNSSITLGPSRMGDIQSSMLNVDIMLQYLTPVDLDTGLKTLIS